MTKEKAIEILKEAYDWSQNGQVTVWSDFVRLAHTDFETHPKVDFENRGYKDVTALIEIVLNEVVTN